MTCPKCAAECKKNAKKCAVCGYDLTKQETAIADYKGDINADYQQPVSTVISFGGGQQMVAAQKPSAGRKVFSAIFSLLFLGILVTATYYLGVQDTFKMTGCINQVKNETPVGTWTVEEWGVDEFITDKLATGTVVNQVLGSFEDSITTSIEKELVVMIQSVLDGLPMGAGSFFDAEELVEKLDIGSYFEGLDETLVGVAGITYEATDVTDAYIASDSDVLGVKIDIGESGTIIGIASHYSIKGKMEYEYDGHGTLMLYVGPRESSVAIVIRCTFEGNTMTWTADGQTIAVFEKVE